MINFKLIFRPKEFLKTFPEDKISFKLVLSFFLLQIVVITLALFFSGFSQVVKEYSQVSSGLSILEQVIIFIVATLFALLLLFVWCLILVLITRLLLIKTKVNWKKLVNIFFYANILHYILLGFLVVFVSITTSIIKYSGEKVSENAISSLVYILESYGRLFIVFVFIIIYICLINIEIKYKKLNNIL